MPTSESKDADAPAADPPVADAPVADAPAADTPAAPIADPIPVSDEDLAAVSASINAFTQDLYRQVASEPGNLIMSPASVAIALGMTYQGATETTADEFKQVLHVEGMDPGQWHAAAGALGRRWNTAATGSEPDSDAGPEIALANRLFGARGVPFKDGFVAQTARNYGAPMERLSFAQPEKARVHINEWVEGQTHDRIRDLIPPRALNGDTLLVLANAIYFKAKWVEPFNASSTADADFFVGGSEKVQVATMKKVGRLKYAVAGDVTVVELPYAGGPFAMTIAMPTERDGLGKLESALAADSLKKWSRSMTYERLALTLPKFKLTPSSSAELSEPLKALGLKRAFTDTAQFETMVSPEDERIKIEKVFHKGFIEVDESGTEAAAATAVVMGRAGGVPAKPVAVAFDRPFLFFIRDTETGAILFMGRVADPR